MTRRGTTTVTIHRDGTVTFWSPTRRTMMRSAPEAISPKDLSDIGANNRDRLISRFGLVTIAGVYHLAPASAKVTNGGDE